MSPGGGGRKRLTGESAVMSPGARGRKRPAGGSRLTPELALEVAAALDTSPDQLDLVPDLLADLDALGSDPEAVCDLLALAPPGPGDTVLDLGCGKGATARAVAGRFGSLVVGVDAFMPFVQAARRAARVAGMGRLCRFRCDDIRTVLAEGDRHDVLLLVSVGPILGDLTTTIAALRSLVRDGGLLAYDDGFLADGVTSVAGWEGYAGLEETRRRLTEHGDSLVAEHIPDAREERRRNERELQAIRDRAAAMARRNPSIAGKVQRYVAEQERQYALLARRMVSAAWLLRIEPE